MGGYGTELNVLSYCVVFVAFRPFVSKIVQYDGGGTLIMRVLHTVGGFSISNISRNTLIIHAS